MFGEVLEHALADAVVGGFDAKGKGVAGGFRALDFAAVDGDDLAELDQVVVGGLLEGADAVFGNDLAHHEAGLGELGAVLPMRGRKREGAIRVRCSKVSWVNDLGAFC